MQRKLEYHVPVRGLNRGAVAGLGSTLFALGLLALTLNSTAAAQVNGMPASVTSPGFGGRQVNGVAPSVTSLGPRGYTPPYPTCCFKGTTSANSNSTPNNQHRHHNNQYLPWAGGLYGAPYYGYYDSGNDSADDTSGDYSGGPTIFDRRGPGTVPGPVSAAAPYQSASNYAPQSDPSSDPVAQSDQPASDQPKTVLVFKDGHQQEVGNYAIVGSTLYDLTGGRHQKIAPTLT